MVLTLKVAVGNEGLASTTGNFPVQPPKVIISILKQTFMPQLFALVHYYLYPRPRLDQVETHRPLPGPLSEREKKFAR